MIYSNWGVDSLGKYYTNGEASQSFGKSVGRSKTDQIKLDLEDWFFTSEITPISYRFDDIEMVKRIKKMYLLSPDNIGEYCFEIKIADKKAEKGSYEYVDFQIKSLERDGKIIKGDLSPMMRDASGECYFDDKANGTIEIDTKSLIVKIEFEIRIYHNTKKHTIEFKLKRKH